MHRIFTNKCNYIINDIEGKLYLINYYKLLLKETIRIFMIILNCVSSFYPNYQTCSDSLLNKIVKMKFIIIINTLLLLAISCKGEFQLRDGKLKITTHYTTGGYEVYNFISNFLVEAFEKYGEFLELEFIPWGTTTRDTEGNLICEAGVRGCFADRVQRCALNMLENNPNRTFEYIKCEFEVQPAPSYQARYTCAHAVGLNMVVLDYCVASANGDPLDTRAEAAATGPMTAINSVPALVFNDQLNIELHDLGMSRLVSEICFMLAAVPGTGITDCTI